eukprot:c4082_g1_i2.p1 GENE.c4082_g1_i2~~c4082_g1_i2.p1  ORF type:complete len:122 (+),score=26.02 c4082_g1_i2:45-410(+)
MRVSVQLGLLGAATCIITYFLTASSFENAFETSKVRMAHELEFAKQTMQVQMTTIDSIKSHIKSIEENTALNRNSCRFRLEQQNEAMTKCQTAMEGALRAREVLHERLPDLYNSLMQDRTQ